MNAYALKIYAYKYKTDEYDTKAKYNETFTPFDSIDVESGNPNFDICRLADMLDENKCIQHDYKNLEKDKIAFITNFYDVSCKIVPVQAVGSIQF